LDVEADKQARKETKMDLVRLAEAEVEELKTGVLVESQDCPEPVSYSSDAAHHVAAAGI
jgi:hypothetical protein